MENRIRIEAILIRNFRSIRNLYLSCEDLNVFVGLNDVGKSNVLKALNLFFNGETDYNRKFEFSRDFSQLVSKKSHRTKEIIIELKVRVPDNYKEHGLFTWRKVWRKDGIVVAPNEIVNEKGMALSPNSVDFL